VAADVGVAAGGRGVGVGVCCGTGVDSSPVTAVLAGRVSTATVLAGAAVVFPARMMGVEVGGSGVRLGVGEGAGEGVAVGVAGVVMACATTAGVEVAGGMAALAVGVAVFTRTAVEVGA
jgi:hypothetical protein